METIALGEHPCHRGDQVTLFLFNDCLEVTWGRQHLRPVDSNNKLFLGWGGVSYRYFAGYFYEIGGSSTFCTLGILIINLGSQTF